MNLTERDLRDKYEKIKTNLNLDGTIWEDIDVELLLLAFTHSSGEKYIPQSISDDQYNKYASNNYEWFEFIGDAVLEMIITTIMTEIESVEILRNAHLFRQELVRNLTLYCYMTRRGLCKEIIKDPKVKYEYKMCADMFEALMGIFYWWGYYIKGMGYTVLEDIREWMTQNWYLQESLDSLLKSGKVVCGVDDKGYEDWSDWSICDSSDTSKQSYRIKRCIDSLNCNDDITEFRSCSSIPNISSNISTNSIKHTQKPINQKSGKQSSMSSPQKTFLSTTSYSKLDEQQKIDLIQEVIRLTLSNSSLPLRARNKLLKSSLELQKYPTTYNDTRSYIYPIIKSLYHSN